MIIEKKSNSNNISLHRGDGLSVFRNRGKQAEKHQNFKDKSLQIIIKWNLKIVDCLDLTLQTALFKNILVKKLAPMSNPTILCKLTKKFQVRFNKD